MCSALDLPLEIFQSDLQAFIHIPFRSCPTHPCTPFASGCSQPGRSKLIVRLLYSPVMRRTFTLVSAFPPTPPLTVFCFGSPVSRYYE
jgi:hypothetical protein